MLTSQKSQSKTVVSKQEGFGFSVFPLGGREILESAGPAQPQMLAAIRWQRVGSYLASIHSWTQSALIEINHRLTFMEMPKNSRWPSFVCPQRIRLQLVCTHTSDTRWEIKTHSRTPGRVLRTRSSCCCFWSETLLNELSSWLTTSAITSQPCQEVAALRSAAAKAQRNQALASSGVSPTQRWWDIVYFEEEECHVRLYGRMGCLEKDTQPSTRLCHGRDLARGPNKSFPFPPLSFQIYFTLAHWRFIIRLVQTHGRRITHLKPHCAIYKAEWRIRITYRGCSDV